MHQPARRRLVALVAAGLAILPVAPAMAFKPYTHVAAATSAYADVVDDGHVTIDGRDYAVVPAVRDALAAWPDHYRAGVIGPDGFPDLTFGQSTIHPEQTGRWLDHVLTSAWDAQGDASRSPEEKGQILAFAYGFLTHAAGDLWAHTFVNDFAHGIFPGVGEIVTDVEAAKIALRHVLVEGLIGDATAGWDTNDDRTTLPDGDVSDRSTPGIGFDAPTDWITDLLVDPTAPLPVGTCGDGLDDDGDGVADDGCAGASPFTVGNPEPVRGPAIDHFLDLQSDLELQEALTEADREFEDCAGVDPDCYERTATVTVQTVRGQRSGTHQRMECIGATIGCVIDPVDLADDLSLTLISENYLEAWIADIEDGLAHWSELGLASTRALFDPQARRNAQNDECGPTGSESDQVRIDCEAGIGAVDVIFHGVDPFINDHLLAMLGLPDVVGDARSVLQGFADVLDGILGPALNPLRMAEAAIREQAQVLVLELVKDATGMDVATFASFLDHPSAWARGEHTLDLGPLGTHTFSLFEDGELAKLNELLGIPEDAFVSDTVELPNGEVVTTTRLADDVEFQGFAAFDNTATTSKLLLLDAAGLNRVAGDQLAAAGVVEDPTAVSTYVDAVGRPANVMIDGLGGTPWLSTIDGDHVWRADGLPRFGPDEDPDEPHGGNGNFPLWESCLLRPAFRTLFTDWETDPALWPRLADFALDTPNFPALGDGTSGDPSDTAPPTATVTVDGGPTWTAPDGTRFVSDAATMTVDAVDEVFAAGGLTVQSRVTTPGGVDPAFADVDAGTATPLPADLVDGPHVAEGRAGEACHPVEDAPATSSPFVLDTTAPSITVEAPAPEGVVLATDATPSIQWTASDGELGSGVATEAAAFDGQPASEGDVVDAYLLAPGTHTLVVTATDQLGHVGTTTRTLRVEATAASLLANVDRAYAEGAISDPRVHRGLRDKLVAAVSAHGRGRHGAELNQLLAVVEQLDAQIGKAIDPVVGQRLRAFVVDLVTRHA